ncbi:MAG: hypothetical protein QOI78_6584 [Actinomycetota bacterium]|nr:hypothetical protein [Actinomycetota bacterium]
MTRDRFGDVITQGFRGLAVARHARAFHPAGLVVHGELRRLADDLPWPSEPVAVVARLSKGVGTPGRLPDALGLALRVASAGETPWDITLTTAGDGHVGRMVPRAAKTWTGGGYSSLVPYRRADRLVWLGAWAETSSPLVPASLADLRSALMSRPLRFVLRTGREDGRWCDTAVLSVRQLIGDASRPAFDPVTNHPAGWELHPQWLAGLRKRAYAGSREGRPS